MNWSHCNIASDSNTDGDSKKESKQRKPKHQIQQSSDLQEPSHGAAFERIQTAGATAEPTQGAPRTWTSDEPPSKEQRGDADGLPIVAPPTPTIYILAAAIWKEMGGG